MLDYPPSDEPRTKVPWAVPIKKCEEPEEPPQLDLEGDPEEGEDHAAEPDDQPSGEAVVAQQAFDAACLEDPDAFFPDEDGPPEFDDVAEPDDFLEECDETSTQTTEEFSPATDDDSDEVEAAATETGEDTPDPEEAALDLAEDLPEPEEAASDEAEDTLEPEESASDEAEDTPEPEEVGSDEFEDTLELAEELEAVGDGHEVPVETDLAPVRADELPAEDCAEPAEDVDPEPEGVPSEPADTSPEAVEALPEPIDTAPEIEEEAPDSVAACAPAEEADLGTDGDALQQAEVEAYSAAALETWDEQEIDAFVADALAFAAPAASISSAELPEEGPAAELQVVDPVEAETHVSDDEAHQDPLPEGVAEAEEDQPAVLCDDAVVRSLMDMLITPTGMIQPQEQAFAADLLLQVVDHASTTAKHMMCDRLSNMLEAPPELISRFLNEETLEISSPLFLRASAVPSSVLISVVEAGEPERCSMIARREHLLPVVSTALAKSQDDAITLDLVRNNCAQLSPEALELLTLRAFACEDLIEPLVNRTEMTAACALFLFWVMPSKERAYVLGRFLADVQVLSQILVMSEGGGDALSAALGSGKGNGIQLVLADKPSKRKGAEFAAVVETGDTEDIANMIALLGDLAGGAAVKIAGDQGGEPLTVACKALGLSRRAFAVALEKWQACHDRNVDLEALKILFDTLSFRQARMALTYWDWQARSIGPYAKFPHKYTGGSAWEGES